MRFCLKTHYMSHQFSGCFNSEETFLTSAFYLTGQLSRESLHAFIRKLIDRLYNERYYIKFCVVDLSIYSF